MKKGIEAHLLGKWGENQVAAYLHSRGYQILELNYLCRFGEVDIIASNGEYMAFVEVKLRRNANFAAAREAVNASKQKKFRAAVLRYLQSHPTSLQPRLDVAEIYAPYGTETNHPHINYLENAF